MTNQNDKLCCPVCGSTKFTMFDYEPLDKSVKPFDSELYAHFECDECGEAFRYVLKISDTYNAVVYSEKPAFYANQVKALLIKVAMSDKLPTDLTTMETEGLEDIFIPLVTEIGKLRFQLLKALKRIAEVTDDTYLYLDSNYGYKPNGVGVPLFTIDERIKELEEGMEHQPKATYFLYGGNACSIYSDNISEYRLPALLRQIDRGLDFDIFQYVEGLHPAELLASASGWEDYCEITEEEYMELSKHSDPNKTS